jgi:microcystin-dependent protein
MAAHKDLAGVDLHEPKGIEDAVAGQVYVADGAGTGSWTSAGASGDLPVGAVSDFGGASAPSGWLLCYGQAVSRTTYASLFSVISDVYGIGDGSTTFNIPDCRGRVSAGQDDMGGSSANRLTGLSNGVNGDTLGAAGGLESFTLATTNLPSHSHTPGTLAVGTTISNGTTVVRNLSDGDFTDFAAGPGGHNVFDGVGSPTESTLALASGALTGSTATAGSGTAMGHIPPTIVFNKIIYAGV